ncbi:hypothetical protein GUJ93_ZPchr0012g19686 [Zizania palustris]|uniref:Uncharacterized protein n=1 Tax=Zizania palustris TaxID=103762 RepID=A0A8J5WXT4_ZIZPA|nr:hypothetical protein GUJ93_ZPchr0012g19686 [Zizania palustris]
MWYLPTISATDLDVVGDALGVPRLQIEPQGAGCREGASEEEQKRPQGTWDAHGHGGGA